jgi:hypothetical protein
MIRTIKDPLRACDKISDALRCRPPGPLARRERRAYGVVCEERATQSAGLRAAARRGAAAGGHLLCWRSSTMSSHRLRRAALHLPARRSRRSASLILSQALKVAVRFIRRIRRTLQNSLHENFRSAGGFPMYNSDQQKSDGSHRIINGGVRRWNIDHGPGKFLKTARP